jgi:hypothetical protein
MSGRFIGTGFLGTGFLGTGFLGTGFWAKAFVRVFIGAGPMIGCGNRYDTRTAGNFWSDPLI